MNTLKSPNVLTSIASATLVGAIALGGCNSPAPSETVPSAKPTTISDTLQEGLTAIRAAGCKGTNEVYFAANGKTYDDDCDSVPNPLDRVPGDDWGDANRNGIPNGLEAYMSAKNVSLNPFADEDRDGAPNAVDKLPGLNDFGDLNTNGLPDGIEPAQATTYYTVDQMKADPNFVAAIRQNAQQLDVASKFYGAGAFTFVHYNLDTNRTYQEALDIDGDRVADPWGAATAEPLPWEAQAGTDPNPNDPIEPREQDPETSWEPQDPQDPQPQNELPGQAQEQAPPQNQEALQRPQDVYAADNRDGDAVPDVFEDNRLESSTTQNNTYENPNEEWLKRDDDGDGLIGDHDPDPGNPMGSNNLRDPFYHNKGDSRGSYYNANSYDAFKADYEKDLLDR